MSSTLASALVGHVNATHYEKTTDGTSRLILRFDHDRCVVLEPNVDGKRFDFGCHGPGVFAGWYADSSSYWIRQ